MSTEVCGPYARAHELTALEIETPAYVYDEQVLAEDIGAARDAIGTENARLLLAMKAFAFEDGLRAVAPLLDGFHASSRFEARLARRIIDGGILHTTTPAIADGDIVELAQLSDRLSFNSLPQLRRFGEAARAATSPGLRVNPQLSFVDDERYDPSARHSKLGAPLDQVVDLLAEAPQQLEGLEGILVHNNCESTDFGELLRVVQRLVERLDPLLWRLKWVNLGGGYLFADADDVAPLREAIRLLADGYGVEVIFEPGTALVARAGSIVTTVVDLFESDGRRIAVLDTAVCHAPEVFEYRYHPPVTDDGPWTYLLAGASCLAGDLFGMHGFAEPLHIGSRIVLTDVGSYSLVRTSWFNGLAPPNVYSRSRTGELVLRRHFSFDDFLRMTGAGDADHRT